MCVDASGNKVGSEGSLFGWVFDSNPRDFDIVMENLDGTTYYSYLLKTEKGNVPFETVIEGFKESSRKNLHAILGKDGKIDKVVLDHTEPDHSGAFLSVLKRFPNAAGIAPPPHHWQT